jgi:hypothetical protein
MSKNASLGNWSFVENGGQIQVLVKGVVVDTVDAPGLLALGVTAINSVLPASVLPLAKVIEGVGAQALAALE